MFRNMLPTEILLTAPSVLLKATVLVLLATEGEIICLSLRVRTHI